MNLCMSKRPSVVAADTVRWSLKVSPETDIALRTFLATRGARKSDLSRFVEEAVNREVLRETMKDIHARNADLPPDELELLVNEELRGMRLAM